MIYPRPGAYQVTTGARCTPEEASHCLFPESASVVLVGTEYVGQTVTYTFLVDYTEEAA